MKKITLLLLLFFVLASCQKSQTKPQTGNDQTTVTPPKDTIPDNSRFNVAIVRDSVVYNESELKFVHTYHDAYFAGEDGTQLGAEYVECSFLSSDGFVLNIDGVPYKPGMVIGTKIWANASGAYFIRAQKFYGIPESIQIWVRDNLLKDSLELHTGNYHFNIDKTDTNTYGKRRFQIILRPK